MSASQKSRAAGGSSRKESCRRLPWQGQRPKLFSTLLLAVSLSLLASALTIRPSLAETIQPDAGIRMQVTTHRDWQVFRPEDASNTSGGCFASHATRLRDSGVTLATVNIYATAGSAADKYPAVMAVKVPIGASLVSGISYRHRKPLQPTELEWQYCSNDTCLASVTLAQAGIDRLKKSRDFLLAYRPLPSSRPLVIPVSLLGFTRAWQDVRDCQPG